MRKGYLLIFIIVLLTLTGCSNDIQISELTYEGDYVNGLIKNVSDDKAYDVTVTFEYKSGSLIEEDEEIFLLRPQQTKKIEIYNPDINENYEISVKKIDTENYEIPERIKYVENVSVTEKQLEYYFEDTIDIEHRVMCTDLSFVLGFDDYPCIDSIKYGEHNDIVITYENDKISIYESYRITDDVYSDEVDSEFAYMSVTLYDSNETMEKEVASELRMRFLDSDSLSLTDDSLTIMQALNHVSPEGQCIDTDIGLCLGKNIDKTNGRKATFHIVASD